MHMDGARIWETAAATGLSLQELCAPFDSVSLCMSKGIGAPIGSVLVGSEKFIYKAYRFRKVFGGALRQTGMLTAAAEYALETHFPQLKKAHQLATKLATGMAELGVRILMPVQTNMAFFDCTPLGFSVKELSARCDDAQIVIRDSSRLVIHHQTSPQAVDDLLEVLSSMKQEFRNKAEPLTEAQLRESKGFAEGVNFPLDASQVGR